MTPDSSVPVIGVNEEVVLEGGGDARLELMAHGARREADLRRKDFTFIFTGKLSVLSVRVKPIHRDIVKLTQ